MVAHLASQLLARVQELNAQIDQLEADLGPRVGRLAPSLLTLRGCGVLTAAKLVGETADVRRFHSKDAYARHNGTAPCRCGRPTSSAIVSAVPATGS